MQSHPFMEVTCDYRTRCECLQKSIENWAESAHKATMDHYTVVSYMSRKRSEGALL